MSQSSGTAGAGRTPGSVAPLMRLSLRFLVPLLIALGIFAYAAVPLVDTLTTRWFVRDLDMRSNLIANTVQEPLEDMIKTGSPARILGFFQRLTERRAPVRGRVVPFRQRRADRHRHVPKRAALLGAHAVHDASASTCCARRKACCTSP